VGVNLVIPLTTYAVFPTPQGEEIAAFVSVKMRSPKAKGVNSSQDPALYSLIDWGAPEIPA
jgi:hypothetical protein